MALGVDLVMHFATNLSVATVWLPAAFIARARKESLRDFGACVAPTTAFHTIRPDRHLGDKFLAMRRLKESESFTQR